MHQPQSCVYGDSGMALRNCMEEGIWQVPDLSQCITIFEDIANVSQFTILNQCSCNLRANLSTSTRRR